MIKVGIIGATGYAGGELARLLAGHRKAEIKWYGSKKHVNKKYYEVYQNFFKITDSACIDDNMEELADMVDLIFTATPQGFCSSSVSENILKKTKVIDLSADFRFRNLSTFEEWYKIRNNNLQLAKQSVYGLCEINRGLIKDARLTANPGCYPTCTILSLYPLIKENLIDPDSIIADAKSGTSGAGRSNLQDNLFCEVNENIKAYGVASHRHTPEIEEQLSIAAGREIKISFTPHLVPMNRGILVTSYASLSHKASYEEVRAAYEKYYKHEKFIRIPEKDIFPQTRWVEGSNYADINFKIDLRTNRIIVVGAIDNLVKGAAGQAVQNMNIMFGLEETEGLTQVPMFP